MHSEKCLDCHRIYGCSCIRCVELRSLGCQNIWQSAQAYDNQQLPGKKRLQSSECATVFALYTSIFPNPLVNLKQTDLHTV